MGKGMPGKLVIAGIVAAGLFVGGCDANQDEISALETEVSTLEEEKRQVFDRLDQAEEERNAAQSQLSLAQDRVRNLRAEVSALRGSVDYLNSQLEALAYGSSGAYSQPEEDPCQDFYDVGVDCPLDGLDTDPFD